MGELPVRLPQYDGTLTIKQAGLTLKDRYNIFRPGYCTTILDGKPLYLDDDHLSRLGAVLTPEKVCDMTATNPMNSPRASDD